MFYSVNSLIYLGDILSEHHWKALAIQRYNDVKAMQKMPAFLRRHRH
jgi:hypothetical protein